MMRSGSRRQSVLRAVLGAFLAAGLAAAGCDGNRGRSPTTPPSVGPEGCAIRLTPFGDWPGAELRGDGFAIDAPVTLRILSEVTDLTLTEAEDPALRTDVRGSFLTVLVPSREDIGPFQMIAIAGSCAAELRGVVDASLFPPPCVTEPPASSGDPLADAYTDLVDADRPVAWWRFEEASGRVAAPEVGAAADLVGKPALAQPGPFVGSRSIGLAGDAWIDIEDIDLVGDFTIEAWIFLCGETVGNEDAVVGQGGPGPDLNFAGRRLRLFDGDADPVIADAGIAVGRWVHVAAVRDGRAVRLVQDGAIVGVGVHEPVFPLAAIGWGNAGRLEGRVDEVAIYDRALTIDRIVARVAAAR